MYVFTKSVYIAGRIMTDSFLPFIFQIFYNVSILFILKTFKDVYLLPVII